MDKFISHGNNVNLRQIREAERFSHIEVYKSRELFSEGSWLQKPVRTITDLYPCFETCGDIRMLDLGCGVGRNCIPFAMRFPETCKIEGVDILETAITMLHENCVKYGVEKNITGHIAPLEYYPIRKNSYDFIIAVSALEHVESETALTDILWKIGNGISKNGMVCLIINSDITEIDLEKGCQVTPQFEVNMKTETLIELINAVFCGWKTEKLTEKQQSYEIPRAFGTVQLNTCVVTYVGRRMD